MREQNKQSSGELPPITLSDEPEKNQEKLKKAVEKIFKKFLPKKKVEALSRAIPRTPRNSK